MRSVHIRRALVLLTAVAALVFGQATAAHASTQDDLLNGVNSVRSANQRPALVFDQTLADAAQAQANVMTGPTHSAYKRSGWILAENVGWGPGYDAAAMVKEWTLSNGHNLNQLGSDYTHAGTGYSPSGAFVVIFGAATAAPVTPDPVTPPNPAPVGPPPGNSDEVLPEVKPPVVTAPVAPYTVVTEDQHTRVTETFPGTTIDPGGLSGIGSSIVVVKKTASSTGVPLASAVVTSTKPLIRQASIATPVVLSTWTSSGTGSSSRTAGLGGGSGLPAVSAAVAADSSAFVILPGSTPIASVTSSSSGALAALFVVLLASALLIFGARIARR